MIDTDKYEGHTPAVQWTTYEMGADKPHHAVRIGGRGLDLELKFGADAQLIADAPDLLAEVKALQLDLKDTVDICDRLEEQEADALAEIVRLREELESIQNSMAWTVQVWWNENYMGREGWMEQMCEVYADLAKGIEAQYHGEEEE